MQEGKLTLNISVLRKLHSGSAPGAAVPLLARRRAAEAADATCRFKYEYEQRLLTGLREEGTTTTSPAASTLTTAARSGSVSYPHWPAAPSYYWLGDCIPL